MSRKFPAVDTIQEMINELIEVLQNNDYQMKKITAQELLAYFEGNAPSGDVITLQDVIGSEWLLIHEIVEINELKKKGLRISSELLFTHTELVFEKHLIATEWELKLAKEKNDVDWIKRRLNDIKTWAEDPTISTRLKEKCINLFRMFEKKVRRKDMKANIKIIEFNPKKDSEELLNSYLDLLEEIHLEIYPDEDPKHSRKSRQKAMLSDQSLLNYYYWLMIHTTKEGEKVIGGAHFYIATEKNPIYDENNKYAWFWVDVAKEYRRNKFGTQLLKKLVEKTNTLKNLNTLQTFSFLESGWAFCENFNGELALEGSQSRLKFDEVNWDLIKQWVEEGETKAKENKTKLLLFENIPEEIEKSYTEFYTEIMNLVPLEDLEERNIETVESMREKEKVFKERGIRWITMITQEADGSISGLTEIEYFPDEPYLIEQELTGVGLKYRGRGLGKWLKGAMLLHIRENFPEVRIVNTGNADINAPMLSINQKMGFKKYLVEKCYKFKTDLLLNKLK